MWVSFNFANIVCGCGRTEMNCPAIPIGIGTKKALSYNP
jgi:hypothetical protein